MPVSASSGSWKLAEEDASNRVALGISQVGAELQARPRAHVIPNHIASIGSSLAFGRAMLIRHETLSEASTTSYARGVMPSGTGEITFDSLERLRL